MQLYSKFDPYIGNTRVPKMLEFVKKQGLMYINKIVRVKNSCVSVYLCKWEHPHNSYVRPLNA